MSGPLSEGVQRLVKALGDLPVTANKVADMPANHGNHLRTVGQSFDATDAKAAAKATDADVPGGGKGSKGSDAPDLTQDERDAILDYTGSTHTNLNALLRTRQTDHPYRGLEEQSENLSSALAKLPDYEGRSYRGTHVPPEILDQLEPGSTYKDPAFTSTTGDLAHAESWADKSREAGATPTLIVIDGKSGSDITELSSNSGESEILFDKDTAFEVVSKEPDGNGGWVLHLREN